MDKQKTGNPEKIPADRQKNGMTIVFIPDLENLCFDSLYDRFIDMTDTEQLIQNISTQTLEAFLYRTAKYFYWGNPLKRGISK